MFDFQDEDRIITSTMKNEDIDVENSLRPKSLDDIVGQEHILGKGKVLRRLIENKNVSNLILFGPPGIGKTTIAQLVAKGSNKKLFKLNGTTASVKDIQEIAKTLDEKGEVQVDNVAFTNEHITVVDSELVSKTGEVVDILKTEKYNILLEVQQ